MTHSDDPLGPHVEDGFDEANEGSGWLSWDRIKGALPASLVTLAALSEDTAGFLTEFANEPKKVVFGFVETWILEFIVNPVFGFAIGFFESIADSALYIAFGEDRMLANYDTLGIVDLPVWLMLTVIDAVSPAGDAVLETIHSVNTAIATLAAKAGITAPIIVPALWLAWFAAAGWITVTVVSAIDIPGIRAVSLFNRFLEPIRGFFRWFK